jgi:hypothetical protein
MTTIIPSTQVMYDCFKSGYFAFSTIIVLWFDVLHMFYVQEILVSSGWIGCVGHRTVTWQQVVWKATCLRRSNAPDRKVLLNARFTDNITRNLCTCPIYHEFLSLSA